MYLLTVSSWVVVCIFAALPFLLTQYISYTDSFFESMSGITATGSTVLSGLDEVKLCVAYRLPDGTVTEDYPLDTEMMAQATAIYETMPGWQGEFSGARTWAELPLNAQAYCQRISDILQIPIDLISVGAERSDLIVLRQPI